MEITDLQAAVNEAVAKELQKLEAEKKQAELDAKTPKELSFENVLRYSSQLPETAYTRDTIKNILTETVSGLEGWSPGGARLEDILVDFFSAIDREVKTPTRKEEWQERRAEVEKEYERRRAAETALIF
jgi:hypothetical protein